MSEIDKKDGPSDTQLSYVTAAANQEIESSCEGNPGADVADPTDAQLATDAAAYLERGGATVESISGSSQEIDRQAVALTEWARHNGLIFTEQYFAGLLKHGSTTAEHDVFYRSTDNRAVKCTHAGSFGVTPDPKGVQRAATPLFYLRRLELMNRVFHSGLRLEGIVMERSLIIGATGEQPRIVTSQPWIRTAHPNEPHPNSKDINEFMESLGFVVLTRSYYGWKREQDNLTILDARPDNFINSPEGVVPIDLVISEGKLPKSIIIGS